mmetsp:Transcript_10567/g.29165  ORF Transcript_10567/g.29165 Transcript_10567/m.29165 type:complete len:210 (+) Transcript_10567:163-792(+)
MTLIPTFRCWIVIIILIIIIVQAAFVLLLSSRNPPRTRQGQERLVIDHRLQPQNDLFHQHLAVRELHLASKNVAARTGQNVKGSIKVARVIIRIGGPFVNLPPIGFLAGEAKLVQFSQRVVERADVQQPALCHLPSRGALIVSTPEQVNDLKHQHSILIGFVSFVRWGWENIVIVVVVVIEERATVVITTKRKENVSLLLIIIIISISR